MRPQERVPADDPAEQVSLPRRQNLADNVYEALKELIMDGKFPQGSRINLDQAARQLQVSQSPLREALVRLESEALVVKEPFRGYSAAPVLSRSELEDLYEFRFVVELWAVRRAAQNITQEGIALLHSELSTCPRAPEGTSYHDYRDMALHDARLHDLIQRLGGNNHMRSAFQRTHCHLHILRLHYRGVMGSAALREHHRIVTAIAGGDPEEAAAAMRAHLEASQARLLPVFDQRLVAEEV
jgi:DNA-binding GntR family transcriptional regulator